MGSVIEDDLAVLLGRVRREAKRIRQLVPAITNCGPDNDGSCNPCEPSCNPGCDPGVTDTDDD